MPIAINQYIADGGTSEFDFTFQVPFPDGDVNVYVTPSGTLANEVSDLLNETQYTLVLNTSNNSFSDGRVIINNAPANGDIVTILQPLDGNITIDFTEIGQVNPANFNKAYAEHTAPINQSFGLFEDRTPRYNVNINASDLQYNSKLPALPPKAFWRRNEIDNGQPGAAIEAQDYDAFLSEVAGDINSGIATDGSLNIAGVLIQWGAVNVANPPGPLDIIFATPFKSGTKPACMLTFEGSDAEPNLENDANFPTATQTKIFYTANGVIQYLAIGLAP